MNAGQLLSLESSLRTIVREAETSSLRLTEELSRRQKSMEELLYDLETVEHRVNKAIDQAQAASRRVTKQESRREPSASVETHSDSRLSASQPRQSVASSPNYDSVPEPASFETHSQRAVPQRVSSAPQGGSPYEAAARSSAHQTQQVAQSRAQQAAPSKQAVNIYGEPIAAAEAAPQRATTPVMQGQQSQMRNRPEQGEGRGSRSSLEQQVERQQVSQPAMSMSESTGAGLEEVYARAEQLLKAGQSLEAVVARTRLPFGEVQMLSQVVGQEQAAQREAAATDADSRLGVLSSSIRRSSQVV